MKEKDESRLTLDLFSSCASRFQIRLHAILILYSLRSPRPYHLFSPDAPAYHFVWSLSLSSLVIPSRPHSVTSSVLFVLVYTCRSYSPPSRSMLVPSAPCKSYSYRAAFTFFSSELLAEIMGITLSADDNIFRFSEIPDFLPLKNLHSIKWIQYVS